MRNAFAFVISAGLGLTAFGGIALADKGPGLFERSDTNGDGFVTKEEFAAGRNTMFAKLDANADGAIDQAEIDKAREAWRQRMNKPASAENNAQAPNKEHRRGFMARIDSDSDGKVTSQEFAVAGDKMFAKLDANGDAKLAKDEMPKRRKHKDGAEGEAPAQ